MPVKLATTVTKIDLISNRTNSELVKKFYDYMRFNGASERHQNNNLKSVIAFANFLGGKNSFTDINKSEQILSFLNTKIRSQQDDPEKKWITP